MIVDNRGGAGGNIAMEVAANAPADGYTIFLSTTGTHAINPSLYKSMRLNPSDAFDSVGLVAGAANVLIVLPSFPASTVPELIALAKQKPGTLTFGSAGVGTTTHLSGELLKSMAHVEIIHIPYKGSAAATVDLLGGQISMQFDTVSGHTQRIAEGKVKAIAVTSDTRSPVLPDVPTFSEAGVSGFDTTVWFGLSVPRGTPRTIIAELNKLLQGVLAVEDVKNRFTELGYTPMPGSPEELDARIELDLRKWGQLIKRSGATID